MPFERWWDARGRWCCWGKPGKVLQKAHAYRGMLYRVSKYQIRRGRRAARSPASQRECRTRIKGANREVSEGKGHLWPLFFPCESKQGAANAQDSWGAFQRCLGVWMGGCLLARRLHQLKAPIAKDLGTFSLKNDWSVVCPLCLLRARAVGRRQQCESIGVALCME